MFSYTADKFQTGIAIDENYHVTGTLKYVKGIKEFGGDEANGNFLVLTFKAKEGVTIKTVMTGGKHPEITVTDGFCLYHMTDTKTQTIQVTYEQDADKLTETYDLSGLTCEQDTD